MRWSNRGNLMSWAMVTQGKEYIIIKTNITFLSLPFYGRSITSLQQSVKKITNRQYNFVWMSVFNIRDIWQYAVVCTVGVA
jgi:hypothetical protein